MNALSWHEVASIWANSMITPLIAMSCFALATWVIDLLAPLAYPIRLKEDKIVYRPLWLIRWEIEYVQIERVTVEPAIRAYIMPKKLRPTKVWMSRFLCRKVVVLVLKPSATGLKSVYLVVRQPYNFRYRIQKRLPF